MADRWNAREAELGRFLRDRARSEAAGENLLTCSFLISASIINEVALALLFGIFG